MKVEEMLREENYQLKNEITDLKNAFDLNRDILKILSSYSHAADPQLHLLMQIITRLTTVNNQAMLSNIELIQQKNVLKKEVIFCSYRICALILSTIGSSRNWRSSSRSIVLTTSRTNQRYSSKTTSMP